jgi:predicted enzyme related to lactoylglutathione lyase
MELQGIGMVSLAVRDWEAALEWYAGTLGLRVVERDDAGGWCQLAFAGDGPTLALTRVPGVDTAARGRCTPMLLVADLDAVLTELAGRGAQVNPRVHEGSDYRIAGFSDPEGNRFQLYEVRRA